MGGAQGTFPDPSKNHISHTFFITVICNSLIDDIKTNTLLNKIMFYK
jgi:hypothetical protein